MNKERRAILSGAGLAAIAIGTAQFAQAAPGSIDNPLLPQDGSQIRALQQKLARLQRRRNFKTVPMILTSRDQWDSEALDSVINYAAGPKQVWDNTQIAGPWLNLMRNSLNTQIWAFKHPDFFAVSATHGTAHLALYDEMIWDKYQLTQLAGPKFPTNTLIRDRKAGTVDAANFEDPEGAFSAADNTIPALQRRGVVFLACHNAIWEQVGLLMAKGSNPDKLSIEAMTAELTNHLIPGAIVTPGMVGTIPELQRTGFTYAT